MRRQDATRSADDASKVHRRGLDLWCMREKRPSSEIPRIWCKWWNRVISNYLSIFMYPLRLLIISIFYTTYSMNPNFCRSELLGKAVYRN